MDSCNDNPSGAGSAGALGFRKVLGPFDVIRNFGPEPGPIGCTIPFKMVAGGQISVSSQDNIGLSAAATYGNVPVVEVWIVGLIQGTPTVLKCQQIRGGTGPCNYRFDGPDAYDTIEIRARPMFGGKPDPINLLPTLFVKLNVSIQPKAA